jgi:hypothetical protein
MYNNYTAIIKLRTGKKEQTKGIIILNKITLLQTMRELNTIQNEYFMLIRFIVKLIHIILSIRYTIMYKNLKNIIQTSVRVPIE